MLIAQSLHGLSHAKDENMRLEHLEASTHATAFRLTDESTVA